MIGKAFTTVAKSACAAVFALTLTGAAFAVDFTNDFENSAREASNQIDRNLQQSARELTTDLQRVNEQQRAANRLGVADSTSGRTGATAMAEQSLNQTINQANRDLYTAADRDNYTFKRRQLENTQLLYAPGTRQYNDINNQIAQLDRDFAREMNDNRNVANRGSDSQSVMNRNWVNSDTNTASTDFNRDRMFETNYSTNNQNRYMNDQNRFMNDQNRFMDNQNRLMNNNDQNRDWEQNWDRYNTSDDMDRMNRTNQFRNTPSTTTSSTFDRTIGGTNVYNTNMNNAANRTSTSTTTVGTPATGTTLTPLNRAATTTTTTRTVGAMTTPTMNTVTTGTSTPIVGATTTRVTTPAVRTTDTGGSFNSAAANMTMSGIGNMSTPTTGTASTGTNIGSTGVGAPVMGNNSTSNTNR